MKVGIVQNSINYGGRLAVVARTINVLNKRGIKPDILAFKTNISSKGIKEKYGVDTSFRIRTVRSLLSNTPDELNILSFGLALRELHYKYDYFINSNNTSFLMPRHIPILSYVHFPRIARLKSEYMNIHDPEGSKKKWLSKKGAFLKMISQLYSFDSIYDNEYLVSNSEFSRSYIYKSYHTYEKKISILYPPVKIEPNVNKPFCSRNNIVSSIGRFCSAKNQIGQIHIAQKLPQWDFHLVGFAEENNAYLKYCREYIEKNKIQNVYLNVNVSNNKKKEILHNSKFFVHTNINEPFGITTVEAIACGCVPLVHNSGGQKEIVPFDNLRFDSIEELISMFNRLDHGGQYYEEVIQQLIEHCKKHFSEKIFEERLNHFLYNFEKNYL